MSRLTSKWLGDTVVRKIGAVNCETVCQNQDDDSCADCPIQEVFEKLAHYEDLEEQGRLIDWRKTSEEKPDSTRHLIVADGEIISHYGYYLKPRDKWFTNWKCEEEISTPIFWADMPEPPKESLHSDCGAKLAELKGTEE